MTREEIIAMARKAGATPYTSRHYLDRPTHTFFPDALEAFAALVLEESAKVCDEAAVRSNAAGKESKRVKDSLVYNTAESRALWLAAAIRAMKPGKEPT